jgi:hypothetical protein
LSTVLDDELRLKGARRSIALVRPSISLFLLLIFVDIPRGQINIHGKRISKLAAGLHKQLTITIIKYQNNHKTTTTTTTNK